MEKRTSCWVASMVGFVLLAQADSEISGKVVTATGASAAGTAVIWFSLPQWQEGQARRAFVTSAVERGHTIADAKGFYRITKLPPGQYGICVAPQDPRYLSSCEWRSLQAVVSLKESERVSKDFVLQEGVRVLVTVNDPRGRLRTAAPIAVIACARDHSFVHARLMEATDTAEVLQFTAPKNTDLLLNVRAPFNVRDELDRKWKSSLPAIPVAVSGATECRINLTAE